MLPIGIHCDDKATLFGVKQGASDTAGEDARDTCVMTFFVPLQVSYLVVGKKSSKSFQDKIKQCGPQVRHVFEDEELEVFQLNPGNLVMFSGAFPHAGYNYRELNVREFFRVYTDGRPGSTDDQHYFEARR